MLMSGSSHSKAYLCAWCKRRLGFGSAKVRGVPASNYGMCATCLEARLVVQLPQLPLRSQPTLPGAGKSSDRIRHGTSRQRSLAVHSA